MENNSEKTLSIWDLYLCFWDGRDDRTIIFFPMKYVMKYRGHPFDTKGSLMCLKDDKPYVKLTNGEMSPVDLNLADIH